jgi:tetratricopeptide (TPR) repeat protein
VVAALGALAVGLSLSLFFSWRAAEARQRAEDAATQMAAINRFLNDDLLRAADPTAPGGAQDLTMRQVLAMAAPRIESELSQAPLTRAALHDTLGNAYAGLGDFANAEMQLRRAISALAKIDDAPDLRAHARYDLAAILLDLSKFKEAQDLLDEADRDAGELVRRPTPVAVQAHLTRGILYDDQSRESEALTEFAAADHLRQIAMPDDVSMLFRVRMELSNALIAARRFPEARRSLEPLLESQFTVDRVGVENWARIRETYAEVLLDAKDFTGAVQLDQAAIKALRANLGDSHLYVAYAASELADAYDAAGKPAEALPFLRESYDIAQKALGADSQNAILARGNLGIAESQLGLIDEGITDLREARTKLKQMFGPDNPEVAWYSFYLAASLSEKGAQAEAWALISTLNVDALSNAGEGGQDWPARAQGLKGQILLLQGHRTEALALLGPAVAKLQADHLQDFIVDPLRRALEMAQRSAEPLSRASQHTKPRDPRRPEATSKIKVSI